MAFLTIKRDSLVHNYQFLDNLFASNGIKWGVVSKLLCGDKGLIRELVNLGVTELHDSRISNLKAIKQIAPSVQTVYIKPPPKRSIPSLVKYADMSFNTELETLKLISAEAVRQDKVHKVIIMVEMGDLREGVLKENLVSFYENALHLPNIELVGLGTNFNCMYGVMPSPDKLIQLSLYSQVVELKFGKKISIVSGGTTVTLPLLIKKQIPERINHFRIGEGLFFGKDLVAGKTIKGMKDDVISFSAEIIELIEKPIVPDGELGENPSGEQYSINPNDYGKKSYRALLDFGLLEVSIGLFHPFDKRIKVAGASSDIVVVDLGKNPGKYKVGDLIHFRLKYMGALGLFNSNYIDTRIK